MIVRCVQVMVLNPWNEPLVLSRLWCLWELHCAVATGSSFGICLSPEQRAAFRARALDSLQNLRKQGFLASEPELFGEFDRIREPGVRPGLETLYIRSSGRPNALARGLDSIVDGRCEDAGILRCIIIDDTPDSTVQRQIDELISDADKRTGIRLLHLDAGHRRRLVDVLSARADIDGRKLRWFMHGK